MGHFIRLFQNAIENVEYRNIPMPEGLLEWFIENFQRSPDKNIKRAVALIFKEFVIQLTNMKYNTAYKDCLVTVLNTGKKSFTTGGEFNGLQNLDSTG